MNSHLQQSFTMNNAKKKTSQGRKKIEIKKIEEVNSRQVTFSKRRAGLFKKASELCVLTGAEIAILVHSPGGRIFAFGHPTVDVLVNRYLTSSSTTTTAYASTSNASSIQKPAIMVKEFNQHYIEVSKELEAEKKRQDVIQESKVVNGSGVAWYNEETESLEVEELQQFLASLGQLKRKVYVRADELMMVRKSTLGLLGPSVLDMGQPLPTMLDMGPAMLGPDLVDMVQSNNIANIDIADNVMAPLGYRFGHDGLE